MTHPYNKGQKVIYSNSSEKKCHGINTCEKLYERSCVSCGKDSKRYYK